MRPKAMISSGAPSAESGVAHGICPGGGDGDGEMGGGEGGEGGSGGGGGEGGDGGGDGGIGGVSLQRQFLEGEHEPLLLELYQSWFA